MDEIVTNLAELGLTAKEAKVYFSLLKNGPLTGTRLSRLLNDSPPVIYRLLKKLEKKGIVMRISDRPMVFKAIPIDIATSILVEEKEREYRRALEIKKSTLHLYDKYLKKSKNSYDEIFIELEGSTVLMNVVQQMIHRAKNEILLFVNTEGLNRMLQWHGLDYEIAASRGVRIRVLTPRIYNHELLSQISSLCEIKFFDDIYARFVVADEDEMILLTDSKIGSSYKHFGIYIKEKSFINTFISIFNFIWDNL